MIKLYGAQWCTFCKKAKDFLESSGKEFEFIDIDNNLEACEFLLESGCETIPQIYENGKLVGGYSDLVSKYS